MDILFCTQPSTDLSLINQTHQIAAETGADVTTDGVSYQSESLLSLLRERQSDDGLVVVLADRVTTLQVRAISREIYVIYIADSYDDLLFLTNKNIRLSGYIMKQPYETAYTKILSLVYADYRRKQLRTDQQFNLVVGKQLHTFLIDDILYFESLNKKINLTTVQMALSFYDSLTELERRLKRQFIRCHSSFLINIKHIRKISLKDLTITLSENIKIPISKKYKSDVIQLVASYKP